jgi:hypothetical protein
MENEKIEELEEDGNVYTCMVCLEKRLIKVTTSCHHEFCPSCIFSWFEKNKNCPICRHKFIENDILNQDYILMKKFNELSLENIENIFSMLPLCISLNTKNERQMRVCGMVQYTNVDLHTLTKCLEMKEWDVNSIPELENNEIFSTIIRKKINLMVGEFLMDENENLNTRFGESKVLTTLKSP